MYVMQENDSMKKVISIILLIMMMFSFVGCTKNNQNENITDNNISSDETIDNSQKDDSNKILIVYFSWSSSGNTEKIANVIMEQTGADILRIEPLKAYPTDYNECAELAKIERDENARPEITNLPDSISQYDTIFIGYPIWWHTSPMIIGTFLENFDFTDVKIYPFAQSASMNEEQFENSMSFVRENAKNADVHEGLFVRSTDVDGIVKFLEENGFVD